MSHPEAYRSPPEVLLVENEVILRSPHNEACYTVEAARLLIQRLRAVVGEEGPVD